MMLILFSIAIFALGFVKRDSRIIFMLQLACIWLFMGWNTGGIDYNNNEGIFYAAKLDGYFGLARGWLSNILSVVFQRLGLGFLEYNVFTTFVALVLMGYVAVRESRHPCMFWELFLIYPFIDSVIQKRFFIGMSLVFFGLFFLRRKRRAVFLASVICAIGFHFSFVFYLPLFFWGMMRRSVENIVIAIAVLAEVVFLRIGIPALGGFLPGEKVDQYLSAGNYSSRLVAIFFFLAQAGYFVLYCLAYSRMRRVADSGNGNGSMPEFVLSLNKYSLVLCPLCMYESAFMRFYRVVILYEYILLAGAWGKYEIQARRMVFHRENRWLYGLLAYLLGMMCTLYLASDFEISVYLETVLANRLLTAF